MTAHASATRLIPGHRGIPRPHVPGTLSHDGRVEFVPFVTTTLEGYRLSYDDLDPNREAEATKRFVRTGSPRQNAIDRIVREWCLDIPDPSREDVRAAVQLWGMRMLHMGLSQTTFMSLKQQYDGLLDGALKRDINIADVATETGVGPEYLPFLDYMADCYEHGEPGKIEFLLDANFKDKKHIRNGMSVSDLMERGKTLWLEELRERRDNVEKAFGDPEFYRHQAKYREQALSTVDEMLSGASVDGALMDRKRIRLSLGYGESTRIFKDVSTTDNKDLYEHYVYSSGHSSSGHISCVISGSLNDQKNRIAFMATLLEELFHECDPRIDRRHAGENSSLRRVTRSATHSFSNYKLAGIDPQRADGPLGKDESIGGLMGRTLERLEQLMQPDAAEHFPEFAAIESALSESARERIACMAEDDGEYSQLPTPIAQLAGHLRQRIRDSYIRYGYHDRPVDTQITEMLVKSMVVLEMLRDQPALTAFIAPEIHALYEGPWKQHLQRERQKPPPPHVEQKPFTPRLGNVLTRLEDVKEIVQELGELIPLKRDTPELRYHPSLLDYELKQTTLLMRLSEHYPDDYFGMACNSMGRVFNAAHNLSRRISDEPDTGKMPTLKERYQRICDILGNLDHRKPLPGTVMALLDNQFNQYHRAQGTLNSR